jgi:hypothetical protein
VTSVQKFQAKAGLALVSTEWVISQGTVVMDCTSGLAFRDSQTRAGVGVGPSRFLQYRLNRSGRIAGLIRFSTLLCTVGVLWAVHPALHL